MNKTKQTNKKKTTARISVSDLTVTLNFEESVNFDATALWDTSRGRNSCWYFGSCGRGWQSKEAVVGIWKLAIMPVK